MKLCPHIGEIKKAGEIGYKGVANYIWHACIDCGKKRWVKLEKGQPIYLRCQSCGCKCRNWTGDRHPNWRGGKYKTGDGYIKIKLGLDDFFYPMADKNGYVLEHRLVVAKALGRCLLPWETVHHKEGYSKEDNRHPEVLELLPARYKHDALTRMTSHIRKLERRIRQLEKRVGEQTIEMAELKNRLRGSVR